MKFRDYFFRRRPPVVDREALADFIDEQSAFLAQKGLFEYSRARAGHYAKVLFTEQPFVDALDGSRWRAYPLGLAMVGELVEGALYPHADDRLAQLDVLSGLVLSVFDRHPTPTVLGHHAWGEARTDLGRRLQMIGLHSPKRAFDIAEPFAKAYYDLMPIHKKLRASEFPTMHNYLKVTLCNIHEELTQRVDAPALVASLRSAP
jgi:hypothetical protein